MVSGVNQVNFSGPYNLEQSNNNSNSFRTLWEPCNFFLQSCVSSGTGEQVSGLVSTIFLQKGVSFGYEGRKQSFKACGFFSAGALHSAYESKRIRVFKKRHQKQTLAYCRSKLIIFSNSEQLRLNSDARRLGGAGRQEKKKSEKKTYL